MTCKVKGKKRKPKVRCTVKLAPAARSVTARLLHNGRVLARSRSGSGALRLRATRRLPSGRYRLRVTVTHRDGSLTTTTSRVTLRK